MPDTCLTKHLSGIRYTVVFLRWNLFYRFDYFARPTLHVWGTRNKTHNWQTGSHM